MTATRAPTRTPARRRAALWSCALASSVALGLSSPATGQPDGATTTTTTTDLIALDDARAADAAFFVLERLLDARAQLDLAETRYAPTVDYYGLGPTDLAAVLDDKRRFFARWPARAYASDLATLRVTALNGEVQRVSVEVEYAYLGATGDAASGRALVEFDLRIGATGDPILVVGERGRVLRRDER